MSARLKIRRHGERAGGKVVLKPDTWDELLRRCSAKLTRDGEPPFVARRLFVADGFEVEALDEIAADDVLVVTAGEDYGLLAGSGVNAAEPSRQSSIASVGSSASEPLRQPAGHLRGEASGPLAPAREGGSDGGSLAGSISSFAADQACCAEFKCADADSRPSAPSPAVDSGVVGGGESAAGGLDLVVIQSSPLTLVHMGRVHPLPQLNALMERERLSEILSRSRRRIRIAFETATTDNVRAVLTLGARALHYSGHGEESCLAFEDGLGSTHQITPPLLASTCVAGSPAPGDAAAVAPLLQLVFVCACYSQPAANAFVRAGVPHVVAVRSTGQVLDQVAICFTRHFYLSLFSGQSVAQAFDVAQAAVRAMPASKVHSSTSARRESDQFVLLPPDANHAQVVFPSLPHGELRDASRPLCDTNLPALSEVFIGRQVLIQTAVRALLSDRCRCVCVVGAGGIGKTALAVGVAHYVRVRHAFPDGVFTVDARGLGSVLQLCYAIAAALRLPNVATASDLQIREELLGALVTRSTLLLIDRCDLLSQQPDTATAFVELLSALLRRAPRLQLLLTCRKAVGVPHEHPLALPVTELQPLEAVALLRMMAPVPASHAALIAELCGCMPLALRLCGCALSHSQLALSPDALISKLQVEGHRLRELRAFSARSGDASIEATIGTSYHALPPRLRYAFLALCEFPGSFDEQAAAALLSPRTEPLDCASADSPAEVSPSRRPASSRPASLPASSLPASHPASPRHASPLPAPPPPRGSVPPSRHASSDHADDAELAALLETVDAPPMLAEVLSQLVEYSMVEVVLAPAGRRYRLHELVRLYGTGQLRASGPAGAAAQRAWRRRLVRHCTEWLRAQSELFRYEDLSALQSFDVERHNVEHAISLAEAEAPAVLARLLSAGRMLLRHRMDHGSRRALLRQALDSIAPEGPVAASPPSPPAPLRRSSAGSQMWVLPAPPADAPSPPPGSALEALAPLLIEVGYTCGNMAAYVQGGEMHSVALAFVIGATAADALLTEAGLPAVHSITGPIGGSTPAADGTAGAFSPAGGAACAWRNGASARVLGPSADEQDASSPRPAAAGRPGALSTDPACVSPGLESPDCGMLSPDSGLVISGASASEDAFEDLLSRCCVDSGVAETPDAAYVELAAEALNLLAVNLDVRSAYRGAQLLFIHALRIRRRLLGPSHPEVASVYNNLANVLRKAGVLDARGPRRDRTDGEPGPAARPGRELSMRALVEPLYRRAISIRELQLGPKSPALAAALSNLSGPLARRGEVAEAEALLRRGLQIRLECYGEDHPEVAHSLNLLANLMHYQLRNYTEAETLYQRALDIRTRYFSRQSDRVAQTLHNLAYLARSQGAEERAERLLTECLAIREDIAGGVHPETQKTAQALASLLRTQGRKEDAARLQRTLDGWRRQQASDADASWLRTSVAVGLERIDPAYRLHSHIIGPRGVHIKHIMQSSGAMQVRLGFAATDEPATAATAGRGAGPPEPPSPAERYLSGGDRALDALSDGLESQRAHALLITASSEEALRRARQLCEEHLAQVRADYARWSARHSASAGAPRRATRDPPPAGPPSRGSTATLADFIKPAKPRRQ